MATTRHSRPSSVVPTVEDLHALRRRRQRPVVALQVGHVGQLFRRADDSSPARPWALGMPAAFGRWSTSGLMNSGRVVHSFTSRANSSSCACGFAGCARAAASTSRDRPIRPTVLMMPRVAASIHPQEEGRAVIGHFLSRRPCGKIRESCGVRVCRYWQGQSRHARGAHHSAGKWACFDSVGHLFRAACTSLSGRTCPCRTFAFPLRHPLAFG